MDTITVKEIKQKLDELGIEYNNRALKDDLLKLLNEYNGHEEKAEEPKEKTYIVTYHRWKDLEDNDKVYKQGEPYDHVGKTEKRIKELSSKNNKIGEVLIKEVE